MTTRRLTMAQAISEAIGQEMERNPDVFVMGEDVGAYGGIFGATGGLFNKFGGQRIIDTPISETAFIGAAIGAAAEGMRPIAELMFVDFFGVCMDEIYNHLAKNTYMAGGNIKLPVVLTTGIGGGYSDAAQHSQCLYATFAHVPGRMSFTRPRRLPCPRAPLPPQGSATWRPERCAPMPRKSARSSPRCEQRCDLAKGKSAPAAVIHF